MADVKPALMTSLEAQLTAAVAQYPPIAPSRQIRSSSTPTPNATASTSSRSNTSSSSSTTTTTTSNVSEVINISSSITPQLIAELSAVKWNDRADALQV